jgi:hypothetical protein
LAYSSSNRRTLVALTRPLLLEYSTPVIVNRRARAMRRESGNPVLAFSRDSDNMDLLDDRLSRALLLLKCCLLMVDMAAWTVSCRV